MVALPTAFMFLLTVVGMTLFGRAICRSLAPDDVLSIALLPEWLVGLGLSLFGILLGALLFGFSLGTMAAVMLFVSFAVYAALQRRLPFREETEHMLSTVVMGALFLLPVLGWLVSSLPPQAENYTGAVAVASALQHHVALPANISALDVLYTLPSLPLLALEGMASFSVAAWMQVLAMVMAAPLVARLAGVVPKWSNLPMVVAGGLIGVTVLNPWWDWNLSLFANQSCFAAAVLLMAFLPLLSPRELPRGLQVLPWAVVLSLSVLISADAVIWMYIVPLLWLLRQGVNQTEDVDIPGLLLLLAFPFMSLSLWQVYSGFSVDFMPQVVAMDSLLAPLLHLWAVQPAALMVVAVLLAALLWRVVHLRSDDDVTGLVQLSGWYVFPALAALAVVLFYTDTEQGLAHLQYILLVPMWQLARAFYVETKTYKLAYKAPWGIGLVLASLLVAGQFAREGQLNPQPENAVRHVYDVASGLRRVYVPAGDKIAVIGSDKHPDLVAVLRFTMSGHAHVWDGAALLAQNQKNFTGLHKHLLQQRVHWLWVYQPTKEIATLFGAPMAGQASYLLRVSENGLDVVQTFSHPL